VPAGEGEEGKGGKGGSCEREGRADAVREEVRGSEGERRNQRVV
jgi:hypothetical protein